MRVTSKINHQYLKKYSETACNYLTKTMDAIKSDLQDSQTMPFDTGDLQNRSMYTDDSKKKAGKVSLIADTPYARRLYFHPEYKFQKTKNPNAGGMWFEPYIRGEKKGLAAKIFARLMKRSTG